MLTNDQRQCHEHIMARNQPYLQQLVDQSVNRHHVYFLFELSDPYAQGCCEEMCCALNGDEELGPDAHEQMRSALVRKAVHQGACDVMGIFLPMNEAKVWAERIGVQPKRWPHQTESLVISLANGCAACMRG
jgi:hypothetical protein